MKLNRKNMIIILIIVGCLLIVSLVFLFRKVSSGDNNNKKDTLSCVKQTGDKYKIQVVTKYKNDKVNTITYKFTNNSSIRYGTKEYIEKPTDTSILLDYFASLVGSSYSTVDNVSTIILNKEVKEYYKDNQVIKTIFGKYDNVKIYYEDEGYTCK